MNNATCGNGPKTSGAWIKQICAIGMMFWLGAVPGIGAAQQQGPRTFAIESFAALRRQRPDLDFEVLDPHSFFALFKKVHHRSDQP